MWGFKKKRADVVDLTEMQKRGILERAMKTRKEINPKTTDGYADLTSSENVDIFSAIASTSSASPPSNIGIKIEDIEFKLNNLSRKIDDILNRLEVVEKKVNIYSRQGSI